MTHGTGVRADLPDVSPGTYPVTLRVDAGDQTDLATTTVKAPAGTVDMSKTLWVAWVLGVAALLLVAGRYMDRCGNRRRHP